VTRSTDIHAPYTTYVPHYSLCSNKLERYLHHKGVPYTRTIPSPQVLNTIRQKTGLYKVPAVNTFDDKWWFDTTTMLQWFDHVGGTFNNTKTTQYRVYRRLLLQEEFSKLSSQDQQRVDEPFEPCGGLEALHADGTIDSCMAHQFELPREPTTEDSYKSSLLGVVLGQTGN